MSDMFGIQERMANRPDLTSPKPPKPPKPAPPAAAVSPPEPPQTTFDTGFGNIDFDLDQLNADLLAYFQTHEGRANLAESGFEVPDVGTGAGGPGDGPAGGGPGGGPTGSEGATVVDTYFEGSGPDRFRITVFDNGYIKRVAAPETVITGEGAAVIDQAAIIASNEREARQKNARDTIAETLAIYGLSDLAEYTYKEIIGKDITDPAAIIFKLREQPAYQKRFAANAARMKAGLPELSPAEYIDLENMYKTVIRSNGLPAGFYDSEDDTRKLLEGTVSPSEFQRRIQDGYNAVANADPEVKRQFKDFYGVTDNELAAYFLDPSRGETILTTRARAAQIAARGKEQGGIRLTGAFAEDLARRGITEQQARAGFAEVGALGELRQAFAGETELSGERLAGAAFGIDVDAQQELERRRRLRTGEFAGGGSFARTTGETSGSISTAVGKAQ
jgi:hypothetical protein